MRHRILATAVLLALLTGCQAPVPVPSGLPSVAPSPSPTPEPTPSSEPEPSLSDDLRPAYQTVRNYLAAYDEWGANPTNDISSVTQYTTDDAQSLISEILIGRFQEGIRVVGEPIYRGWQVSTMDSLLDGTARAKVELCSDNAKMTIVAKEDTRRPAVGSFFESYVLHQMPDKSWRIADYSNEEQRC
ncbi:MAG: hypothetical protein Q4B08_10605 [Propionibacteriaceae bacterium]|nr:hypothetical protein [Propionibacteriaceae bacterium]